MKGAAKTVVKAEAKAVTEAERSAASGAGEVTAKAEPGGGATTKFASEVEETVGDGATKGGGATSKVVVEAEEALVEGGIKAGEKFGVRALEGIGRFLLEMGIPGPEDAIMMMADFAGSYAEAWKAMERRGLQRGFAGGFAAQLLGFGSGLGARDARLPVRQPVDGDEHRRRPGQGGAEVQRRPGPRLLLRSPSFRSRGREGAHERVQGARQVRPRHLEDLGLRCR